MEVQDNKKQHKINTKLRKKRQQLKAHKKQKKMAHEKYNPQDAKLKFFNQTNSTNQTANSTSKLHKLKTWLYRFTKVFDEDMEDFYDIWRNLDEGGEVDIEDIENQQIKTILSNICKCLPLIKLKNKYIKDKDSKVNIRSYIKIKTQQIIQECLLKDSLSQYDNSQDEIDPEHQNKLTKIKQIKPSVISNQTIQHLEKPLNKDISPKIVKQSIPIIKNIKQIQKVINMIPTPIKKQKVKSTKRDAIDRIFDQAQKLNNQKQNKHQQRLNTSNDHLLNLSKDVKSLQSKAGQSIVSNPNDRKDVPQNKRREGSVSVKVNKLISSQKIQQDSSVRVNLSNFKESIKDGYLFNFMNTAQTLTKST